jgi:hypothetical protein
MTVDADTGSVDETNPTPVQADMLDEQVVGKLVEQALASGLQLSGDGGRCSASAGSIPHNGPG